MRFSSRHYVLIILAVTVFVLALAEVGLRTWVVPVPFSQANRTHLIYTADGNDAVIGDSHTASTFLTTENFVNLAVGGSAISDLENVSREFYRHREPGRIIIQASPQIFARPMRRADHSKYYRQNVGLPFQLYVFEPGVAANVMDLLDSSRLQRKLDEAAVISTQQGNWHNIPIEERLATTQKRVNKQRPRHTFRDQIATAYRRMITELAGKGVTVCMLRTPVTQEYLGMIAGDEDFLWSENFFKALAAEFDVPYVDSHDLPVSYDMSMFTNMDHLASNGADIVAPAAIKACFGDGRT